MEDVGVSQFTERAENRQNSWKLVSSDGREQEAGESSQQNLFFLILSSDVRAATPEIWIRYSYFNCIFQMFQLNLIQRHWL